MTGPVDQGRCEVQGVLLFLNGEKYSKHVCRLMGRGKKREGWMIPESEAIPAEAKSLRRCGGEGPSPRMWWCVWRDRSGKVGITGDVHFKRCWA